MPTPDIQTEPLWEALIADPHTAYAHLHQTGPVRYTHSPDGAPIVLVTGYHEVRAALADPRLCLNKRYAASSGDHGASMPEELSHHLANLDPPDHTRLRGLVSQVFTPRRIEALRPQVETATDSLLDALTSPQADLVAGLAAPLPMTVICDLLGIPPVDRRDFRDWTDTLLAPAPDSPQRSRAAVRAMGAFLHDLINRKRDHPGDDLLTALIEARDDGDRLTEGELIGMAFLLLFAGYDNVVHLISTVLLALLTQPRLHQDIRDGTTPLSALVDEALRRDAPAALAVRRFAREDLDLGGTSIPAGSRVWLSLGAAHHDPTAYPAPADMDLNRAAPHMAFGRGIHHCLGAALARLEVETAVTRLLRRFPNAALSVPEGQLAWKRSLRSRGLTALPVILQAEQHAGS